MSEVIINPYSFGSAETQYCQPYYDEALPIGVWYGGGSRAGVQFLTGHTAIGQTLTKATQHLKKTGSPTGTMYVRIYNSSGTAQFTFGSKDVSTLTGTTTSYQFENATGYTLQANDVLASSFTGGDASNYVRTTKQNATGYTNENFADYPGESFRFTSDKGNSYCVTY
tara:strand:- start:46 stop:549 length:504 start_codon:yes stop_codon:yes gene_type:complete